MEPKRKALGRGLGALIPVPEAKAKQGFIEYNEISISTIRPNPYQPRQGFADETLEELARSIRSKGILQPLVVREVPGGYELIAGERRFRAAQRAGLQTVPVIIRQAKDDERLEISLIENIQRENLNPLEEAKAYRRLIDDFHLTQEQIAERVAKDRSTVANTLRLLQLPGEIQEKIAYGDLSAGHARALASAGSVAAQVALAREVVARRLSVRETERLVSKHRPGGVDPDHRAVEERLSRCMGTKVRILVSRSGQGKVEIHFHSLAELNGLVDRLTVRSQAETSF